MLRCSFLLRNTWARARSSLTGARKGALGECVQLKRGLGPPGSRKKSVIGTKKTPKAGGSSLSPRSVAHRASPDGRSPEALVAGLRGLPLRSGGLR